MDEIISYYSEEIFRLEAIIEEIKSHPKPKILDIAKADYEIKEYKEMLNNGLRLKKIKEWKNMVKNYEDSIG